MGGWLRWEVARVGRSRHRFLMCPSGWLPGVVVPQGELLREPPPGGDLLKYPVASGLRFRPQHPTAQSDLPKPSGAGRLSPRVRALTAGCRTVGFPVLRDRSGRPLASRASAEASAGRAAGPPVTSGRTMGSPGSPSQWTSSSTVSPVPRTATPTTKTTSNPGRGWAIPSTSEPESRRKRRVTPARGWATPSTS